MNTIPKSLDGNDAISYESVSEKVKITRGQTISIDLDLANVTELIPGALMKHTSDGYVELAVGDTVGEGSGLISPALVVISNDYYNKALGYKGDVTAVKLTSEWSAWMAWNHEEAAVSFGDTVYIAAGVLTATSTPSSHTEGTYIVGFITEDQTGSESDNVWKMSADSGTRQIPSA